MLILSYRHIPIPSNCHTLISCCNSTLMSYFYSQSVILPNHSTFDLSYSHSIPPSTCHTPIPHTTHFDLLWQLYTYVILLFSICHTPKSIPLSICHTPTPFHPQSVIPPFPHSHTHMSGLILSNNARQIQLPLIVGEEVTTLSHCLLLQRVGKGLVVLTILSHNWKYVKGIIIFTTPCINFAAPNAIFADTSLIRTLSQHWTPN